LAVASDGKALLSERFDRALQMASRLHQSQLIKGSESRPVSYLAHILAVVAIVLGEAADEDVAIAAALHDGPEDQGGRPVLDQIRTKFGDRVADIVDACTDTFDDPKPDWEPRKLAYIARLSASTDRGVLLVKCADCLANARATLLDYRLESNVIWARFRMPCASNQLWWYESCRNALKEVSDTRAYVQLDETVKQLMREVEPCPGCENRHLAFHRDDWPESR
jgi:(p)ppGpp synthase/HD superfamily hydrolase